MEILNKLLVFLTIFIINEIFHFKYKILTWWKWCGFLTFQIQRDKFMIHFCLKKLNAIFNGGFNFENIYCIAFNLKQTVKKNLNYFWWFSWLLLDICLCNLLKYILYISWKTKMEYLISQTKSTWDLFNLFLYFSIVYILYFLRKNG